MLKIIKVWYSLKNKENSQSTVQIKRLLTWHGALWGVREHKTLVVSGGNVVFISQSLIPITSNVTFSRVFDPKPSDEKKPRVFFYRHNKRSITDFFIFMYLVVDKQRILCKNTNISSLWCAQKAQIVCFYRHVYISYQKLYFMCTWKPFMYVKVRPLLVCVIFPIFFILTESSVTPSRCHSLSSKGIIFLKS